MGERGGIKNNTGAPAVEQGDVKKTGKKREVRRQTVDGRKGGAGSGGVGQDLTQLKPIRSLVKGTHVHGRSEKKP